MVKYGDFTIILDETIIFFKSLLLTNDSSNNENYYKYNNEIIYTFYDNKYQNYSDREIYTASNDYKELNIYFNEKSTGILHPLEIYSSSFYIKLKMPTYDKNTTFYNLRLSPLYDNMSINPYKILSSQFNCIYMNSPMDKEVFSIAKCNSSDKFPKFIFCYDDELLTKKEVIYLIKKLISKKFN
jgi:hypothetical protein